MSDEETIEELHEEVLRDTYKAIQKTLSHYDYALNRGSEKYASSLGHLGMLLAGLNSKNQPLPSPLTTLLNGDGDG